ncbi:hypothetical protein ACQJBY_069165 [Aegilops geniculata]
MVRFGKKLTASQVTKWRGYYINYELMKKKVKQYGQQLQQGEKDRRPVLKDFSKMLDDQTLAFVWCGQCSDRGCSLVGSNTCLLL